MAIKKAGGAKSAPLDPKVADKLLDLLSTDNEFRRLFKKDPQAALAKLGHRAPPTTKRMCASIKAIAPKQEIADARDQLNAHMISSGIFTIPHCFEAVKVASCMRRK
jgi:putative modified peptide